MKLMSILTFVASLFFLTACGGGGGDPFNPSVTLYSGSYSGDDAGSMRINIDSRGNVTGQATGSGNGLVFTLSGNVNSTEVSFTAASTSTTLVFSGTLDSASGLMSGTWHYAGSNLGGTFSARS